MLKEIIIAIQAYFQTHRFIIKHRLWKWIFIPGLIYSILFCAGVWLFLKSSNYAIDFVLLKTGIKEWLQQSRHYGPDECACHTPASKTHLLKKLFVHFLQASAGE